MKVYFNNSCKICRSEINLYKKEKIEEIISSTEDKSVENLYNLGICYEALGEPRIAIQLYEEALRLDEANSNVIEALGALQNKIL